VKISNEHVIPQWIDQVLTSSMLGPDMSFERTIVRAGVARQTNTWSVERVAVIERRLVCKECNSGWMGELEGKAKALLKPMILGCGATLSADQQLTIATWAAMKTMVHEFVWGAKQPPISPQTDRNIVMRERRPPANMQIRLAAVGLKGRPVAVFQRVHQRKLPSGQAPTTQDFVFCVTIVLGCLVVQIFGGPATAANKFDQTTRTSSNFLPIYPPNVDAINWPPAVVLDDASLEVFAHPLQPLYGLCM
jgi:hypothetical protein